MSDSKVFFPSQPILPVDNSSLTQRKTNHNTTAATGASFADIMQKASQRVTFSSHALQRMESRNLNFSEKDLQKLDESENNGTLVDQPATSKRIGIAKGKFKAPADFDANNNEAAAILIEE